MPARAWSVVAVLLVALADDKGTAPQAIAVPATVYRRQLDEATKLIRDSLQGEVRPRTAARAATAAVMLAAIAQHHGMVGDDGAKPLAVRDAALEIAGYIRKKDYAAALKRLDALPTLAGDPKAKREWLPLEKKIDYKDVMAQFRAPREGGLGIEDRLDALGRSPDETLPAKELTDALQLDAYRSLVAAELLRGHEPKSDAKEWRRFADAMRAQSLQLATAVRDSDGKAAYKAINQLNRTCDSCHQAFRKD